MSDTAAKIHVAETPPSYCASCHQQKPDEVHIDFGAYLDGPVMQLAGGGQDAVAIDDLVVCATCMRAAANAMGFVNAPDLEAENRSLRGRLERARTRAASLARALRLSTDGVALLAAQKTQSLEEVAEAAAKGRRAARELRAFEEDHEMPPEAEGAPTPSDLATV